MIGKEYGQKFRLMKIIEILMKETDKEHPISTQELITKLAEYDMTTDRKTIYNDIKYIDSYFIEINTIKKNKSYYYTEDRTFDESELKILISAIQTAGFISESKTRDLITKVCTLTSDHYGKRLTQNIEIKDTNKHSNNEVFLNVSNLIDAISKGKKVKFKYFHYNLKKEKIYKDVITNPVDLVYNDSYYYLIVYNEKYDNIIKYRIDKMISVILLEENRILVSYDSNEYVKKTFNMFDGVEERVTLKCKTSLVDTMLDRFGEKAILQDNHDNTFSINVAVNISPTFYAYIATFGCEIELISPVSRREEYKKYLEDILKLY